MAKRKQNVDLKRLQKPVVKLNSLFNDVIDNISYGSNKSDSSRQRELNKISSDIDSILSDELYNLTSFTGEDIGVFLTKLYNEYNNDSMQSSSIDDIFSKEDQGLFEVFKSRYKNKLMLYEDLESISEQLYELNEAIMTTRDSILTADDISVNISRSIKFTNNSKDSSQMDSYIKEIEKMEERYNLAQKIKEHICPKTLQLGSFYAYTIPYSKIFNDASKKLNSRITLESFTATEVESLKPLTENKTVKQIEESMNKVLENISVSNDSVPLPVMENANYISEIESIFKPQTIKNNKSMTFNEGVVDNDEENFDGVKDCYIEYMSPSKLIPIKVLNKKIGYYYIREDERLINKETKNIFSMNMNLASNDFSIQDVERQFVTKITDKIVSSFNKKFLEENIAMKELITNALMHDELYKKKVHFQFIPAEYITEFKVNPDINDEGVSILYRSLFNAKLYLGILIFKITSILTKSNDTKITYVRQLAMDKNISNQIQNIARDMKMKQPTFKDLFNYNGLLSKAGSARDIFMPVGKSGERGLEFDILSGQQVDLNSELLEKLRSGYISGTGVPSVIMNYINEADYAKTLIMANAKYVARVISYQKDFNHSLTELYKKIARFSTSIPDDMLTTLQYTLSPPKAVNTNNMIDLISNSDQIANSIIKVLTGENADQTDKDNKVKDFLYTKVMKEYLPMIQWGKFDEFLQEAKMEAVQHYANKEAQGNNEESSEY